ncbi:MAG: antibiotic biosynthesis monooxygenase [Lysobacterales bacterium]
MIFASQRSASDPVGYGEAAARMMELAARQPGLLGVDSARAVRGFGLTVSYWRDEASIAACKRDAERAATRERGRNAWYDAFEVRVAKVERAYGRGRPE